MTESTTTRNATPTLDQERRDLLSSLAHARHFLRFTARDLTTEHASQRTTVSNLTIGGLIKHVTEVERGWADFLVVGADYMEKDFTEWTEEDFAERDKDFQLQTGETLEGALRAYDEVAARTDELVRTLPSLDVVHELPKAPWNIEDAWSVRRALLHIVAETTQHAGHADIIRESLDGSKSMG
ncbi:DinB family protein [Rhodococcus pyridinivorans]|uniref:DinB family protein n=1 Tax=Rhodococcus pyridinivorans TaxID=103816 RepID=UPI00280A7567|nr:DinB family protein [Rhodococcus pyridinivorans]WMM74862.1 DinB family protein [Rhodococcus pyridinivorans]